jgi:hypothetical protein
MLELLGWADIRRSDEDAARRIVEVLGEPAAREFHTLLESDDAIRADIFRQFYERDGHEALLDALTDLEASVGGRGLRC